MMKTLIAAVVASVALVAGGGLTAYAAADISVPLDTVIVGGVTPGEQVELSVTSSGPFQGATCNVQAKRSGGGEAHAGNDLTVTSGTAVVSLVDVEREPAAVTDGSAPIVLGEVITVELAMGPDARYDGDVALEFTCGGGGENPAGLPVTGTATGWEALLAAALVGVGGILLLLARRPATESTRR
jgi:hypothetical protein